MAPALSRQQRDAVVRRFLPLADALAWRLHRRCGTLLDRDDLIQVARLALVQAAGRLSDLRTAPAYLKRCISGGLCHHLRDHALLVRLPKSARHTAPWRHLSLDAPLTTIPGSMGGSDGGDGGGSTALCALDLLPAPPPPQAAHGQRATAEHWLALLQPRQAEVLRLTVLDGHSLRQAARVLGVSVTTVSRSRRQALEQLRRHLDHGSRLAA